MEEIPSQNVLNFPIRRDVTRYNFLREVSFALDVYRTGTRPDPRMIIKVKQAIFRKPSINSSFEMAPWDPWREDDLEFDKEIE